MVLIRTLTSHLPINPHPPCCLLFIFPRFLGLVLVFPFLGSLSDPYLRYNELFPIWGSYLCLYLKELNEYFLPIASVIYYVHK